jgi:hypothetical protein
MGFILPAFMLVYLNVVCASTPKGKKKVTFKDPLETKEETAKYMPPLETLDLRPLPKV